jgi:hypothetical protein
MTTMRGTQCHHTGTVTVIRWQARTRPGSHWHTGRLTSITRHAEHPYGFTVEAVDARTGNTRTLDTIRHRIRIRHHGGRWVTPTAWAATTCPLFTLEEP